MIEGHENKNIPVMETTIEGAQKRITNVIELIEQGQWGQVNGDLEYIAVFLDSMGDEMVAVDEWKERLDQLQADFDTLDSEAAGHLADKIELQKEIDELRKRIDLNA